MRFVAVASSVTVLLVLAKMVLKRVSLLRPRNGHGLLRSAEADPESVAGVRIGDAVDTQPNGATGIARNIKIVAASANET